MYAVNLDFNNDRKPIFKKNMVFNMVVPKTSKCFLHREILENLISLHIKNNISKKDTQLLNKFNIKSKFVKENMILLEFKLKK